MDKRTLTALEGSIEKWRKIVFEDGVDEGSDNCPLCQEFWQNECIDCPVAVKVGQQNCYRTPYEDWSNFDVDLPEEELKEDPEERATISNLVKSGHNREDVERVAREEYDFLRSLLPQEEFIELFG